MQQQRGPTHTHAHCRPTKPPPSSSETRCRPDDDETICHFRSPNGHAVTSGFDFQHAVSWWCFAVTIALKCTYRHQPPHRTVLGQVDRFVQCEVVGSQFALDGVQPHDTWTPWWSLPVVRWGSRQDHLGIRVIIRTCNMPKYGKTP